jgi:hypothetical protein
LIERVAAGHTSLLHLTTDRQIYAGSPGPHIASRHAYCTSGSVRGNGAEVSCERDRWIYMGDTWTRETDGHIWETDRHIWETYEYVWETVS